MSLQYLKPYISTLILASRRGLSSFPVTQLLVINPTHKHVPTPDAAHNPGYYSVGKVEHTQSNPMNDMIYVLKRRGILAGEFRCSSHKWSGMVRIPSKSSEGDWEPQKDRLKGVQERTGEFRRVDIV